MPSKRLLWKLHKNVPIYYTRHCWEPSAVKKKPEDGNVAEDPVTQASAQLRRGLVPSFGADRRAFATGPRFFGSRV